MQADVVVGPEVEGVQPRDALGGAVGDVVQVLLHGGREVVVDHAGEVPLQQVGHREGAQGRHQGSALLEHVLPLDGLHDRGVGGRPAHAVLLHALDQRGLGVAGRRLGGMALGDSRCHVDLLAHDHRRQDQLGGIVGRLFPSLLVGPSEPLVVDHRAAGRQGGRPTHGPRSQRRGHAEADRLALHVGHLGGNGPSPDHLVDVGLGLRELATHGVRMSEAVAGRPDGLVGLLGVADLVGVGARRVGHVVGAEPLGRLGPCRPHRGVRQRGAVGPHVGDVALLVQALGGVHGPRGRELEAPPRLLLEGRRGERGRGPPRVRLGLNRLHGGRPSHQVVADGPGRRLVQHQHVVARRPTIVAEVTTEGHPTSVDLQESGRELDSRTGTRGIRSTGGHGAVQVPVVGGPEGHALAFALHDHPGGHALHPSRREPGADHPPEHR